MNNPDILNHIDIFAQLSEEDRRNIAGLMKEQNVCNGTILLRQGDAGNALYYVLFGQLAGTVTDADGVEKPVISYCQGQYFGEMGLLIGEKSPYTFQATADTRLLVLEKDDFDRFLGQNIPAMLRMMKVIAQRKAESKQQRVVRDVQPAAPPSPKPQPPIASQAPVAPPTSTVSENIPLPEQVSTSSSKSQLVDQGDVDRFRDAQIVDSGDSPITIGDATQPGSAGDSPAVSSDVDGKPLPISIESAALDVTNPSAAPPTQEIDEVELGGISSSTPANDAQGGRPLTYASKEVGEPVPVSGYSERGEASDLSLFPGSRIPAGYDDHINVDLDVPVAGGKVFTIFSPKGGVGKSTLAVNLAVAMARSQQGNVALLDLSLTFGHVPLMLNLAPRSSLALANPDALRRLDLPENMDHYLALHPSSSLRVMAGAQKPEEGELVSADVLGIALQQLRRHFAYLVIDTSSQFTDPVLAALEASDRILVICSPEMSILRDIRECQRIWDAVRIPRDRVFYVMNNIFPFKTLSRAQLEDALQKKLFAELPYGGDAVAKTALKGETLIETRSGSPLARSIQAVASQLTAEGKTGEVNQDRKRSFFR